MTKAFTIRAAWLGFDETTTLHDFSFICHEEVLLRSSEQFDC